MAEDSNETMLSLPEAVLLGHAMVQRVVDALGIRAFFIKGPVSVLQGLREPRVSGDVDVFVAPSDVELILLALEGRGWQQRPSEPESGSFPKHSVTIGHPRWPCCIDVHFRFPGMDRPAARSFETMWANTVGMKIAGQEVRVPSIPLGILVIALHALRTPRHPSCRQELEFLSRFTSRHLYADAVLKIAMATGSLAAVRPFLEDLLSEHISPEWPDPSLEWRNRGRAQEPGSARFIAIMQAPWRDKARLLWRALFPRSEVFLSGNIYADMSLTGRLRLHSDRWKRFLRGFPRLVRNLRGLR